jgi:hypothetical protein
MTSIKLNSNLQIISSLFIFLFVYTAVSKYLEFENFKRVLSQSPIIGHWSQTVAVILPLLELILSLLLFIPKTRIIGIDGSFSLMSLFTIYIGYMIAFTPHLPCSCGGVLKQMNWGQHLGFNLFFAVLAFIGSRIARSGKFKHSMRNIAIT